MKLLCSIYLNAKLQSFYVGIIGNKIKEIGYTVVFLLGFALLIIKTVQAI